MKEVVEEEFAQSDYSHVGIAPRERGVYLQHHVPKPLALPYHFHPSIEVNFLQGTEMTYSFSGQEVTVPKDRFCVFWAARPHRTISVAKLGKITNAYAALSEFLRWGLPAEFVNLLLSGAVICSKQHQPGDRALAERWAAEVDNIEPEWQRVHALELQTRLSRLALEGFETLYRPTAETKEKMIGGTAVVQFEAMLRFVAEHFSDRITISDVAKSADVSSNYAISLFSKMLGRTIKSHITDMRVFHAKMLLVETETKILTIAMDCGFGSLSSFYRAFESRTGVPPAAFRRGTG